jgi:hypothetical protein
LLFSHSSRHSIFRASRWGASVLPSSCCRWRSTTSWGLAFFSHHSASRIFIMQPGCSSPPVVIQNDVRQPCGGEERAGLWPPPCPQLQGCSSSVLGGRGKPSWGPAFRMGWRPASPSSIRGRRTFTSLAEEANCHLLPGRGVAVRPPHGRRSRRAQVSHVHGPSRAAGHTGGSYKTSYAVGAVSAFLDGLVLTPVARTGARTSLCALGRPPFAGAALVRRWPLSSVLRWWPP